MPVFARREREFILRSPVGIGSKNARVFVFPEEYLNLRESAVVVVADKQPDDDAVSVPFRVYVKKPRKGGLLIGHFCLQLLAASAVFLYVFYSVGKGLDFKL